MTTSLAHRKSIAAAKKTKPAVATPLQRTSQLAVSERSATAPKSKPKLVRDSFTIPKDEYAVLESLKLRAANLKRPTKKSEVLRAGILTLNKLSDKAFLIALNGVQSLKTGRPRAGPEAER